MFTICRTHAFDRAAAAAVMTEDEIDALVGMIAENPLAGDLIQGSGGCRKVLVAGRGKGKSGGYRTIMFFGGNDVPVFLLTVFGKGEKSSLSQAEVNSLRVLTGTLVEEYRKRVVTPGVR